ncbi:hypothetical protein GLOIN_2v1881452 [Rhizophagus irregularis DAOM 181602=DAOM 197198]|nr:hypothetical protein GLOIN_2v1881452 [Rhizophagus irregularis DAOM 181602=DAOM 197198]
MKTTKRILDLEEKSSISIKQERKYFSNGINININIGRPKSPILDSFFSSFHLTKQKSTTTATIITTTTNVSSTTPTSESSSQGQKPKPEGKCPFPLTIDCLEEIFSHLIDDKLTLFSCILVNSLWLNLCIPLLWNNPFDYSIPQKNQLRLIRTYISCLSINDKQKLLKFYLDPLKYSQISLHHEPLFIYPKYLRGLNYNNFDSAIKNYCYWNRPLINPLTDSLDELKFSKEIRTLLHNNDYYIDNNEINEINSNNDNNNNDIPIMITGINTFTRLTTLDLSYMYSSEISKIIPQQISNICSHLSTHSTHIQCLTIYMQKCKISKDLLSTITLNCPNITNLSLLLDPTLIPDFCALLVSLPKLHSLTIKKSFYRLSFNYIDFKNLAINLPNSLYYFKTDLFDNSKSLNYFLETCNIDVKLGVLEIYQQLVNDDTLNAILNYKKKSNDKLKTFKYSGSRIMFNDQTWELTKKILPDLVKIDWN